MRPLFRYKFSGWKVAPEALLFWSYKANSNIIRRWIILFYTHASEFKWAFLPEEDECSYVDVYFFIDVFQPFKK